MASGKIVWSGELVSSSDDDMGIRHACRIVVAPYRGEPLTILEQMDGSDALGVDRWKSVTPEGYAKALLRLVAEKPPQPSAVQAERLAEAEVLVKELINWSSLQHSGAKGAQELYDRYKAYCQKYGWL